MLYAAVTEAYLVSITPNDISKNSFDFLLSDLKEKVVSKYPIKRNKNGKNQIGLSSSVKLKRLGKRTLRQPTPVTPIQTNKKITVVIGRVIVIVISVLFEVAEMLPLIIGKKELRPLICRVALNVLPLIPPLYNASA